MSVSPNLKNSTPEGDWAARHERLRVQPEALAKLTASYERQLKFVVSAAEDLDEINALLATLQADRSKVILMPEGIEPSQLRQRGEWPAEICKREGFRYSPRRHVDLHGNRRGI
jgi:7-carboxy-7-deazaguanine synthase